MDKYEERRLALKSLVDTLGRGGIARVATRLNIEPSYVSRMLFPAGRNGRKRIGEDMLDALVEAYPDWFASSYVTQKTPQINLGEAPASQDNPSNGHNNTDIRKMYQAAGKTTQAAVDLMLMPDAKRKSFGVDVALAISVLENRAPELLPQGEKHQPQGTD